MLVDLARTFLAWAIILPVTYLSGSIFCSFLRNFDFFLQGILYSTLGMALLSMGIAGLGLFHGIRAESVWALLFLVGLWRLKALADWWNWVKAVGVELMNGQSWPLQILQISFGISFVALLAGTLSPEIGGDALCYHLNLPKLFLAQGSLAPIEYDGNSYYPLFMNNLYLIGLATGGVYSAKLFHFFCGFLLFLTLYRVIVLETGDKILALFMSLVLWTTPTLYNQLSTTYVDVAMASFIFFALVTLVYAFEGKDSGPFLVSGFLLGCAVAIKYLALISVLGFLILWAAEFFKRGFLSNRLKEFCLWGVAILLPSGYWFLRNWVWTGNPLYPFFGSWFGVEDRPPIDYFDMGIGKNLWAFISVFWNMMIYPDAFGALPNRISAFYLLFSPLVLLSPFFAKRSWPYFLFFFSYLTIWFCLAQAYRWLIPALPAMNVVSAMTLHNIYHERSKGMKRLLKMAGGIVGGIGLGVYLLGGIYHYRYAYYLNMGRWSMNDYLRRLERTYPIAQWINQNLPPNAKILLESEPSKFYFNRPVIEDKVLRWYTKYDQQDLGLSELRNFIKAKGVSYFLLSHPVSKEEVKKQSGLQKLAGSEFAAHILTLNSENIRDAQHIYHLYQLQ